MAQLMSIKKNVDVQPGVGVPAIFHCSQGDKGTRIILGLLNNNDSYTIPEGTTAIIRGSRADGTLFTEITADIDTTTEIKFNLTEDITSVAGPVECEAVMTSGSANVIGTANFIINVEKSPASIGSVIPGTDAAETWLIDELTNLDLSGLDDESVVEAVNKKLNGTYQATDAGKVLMVNQDGTVSPAAVDLSGKANESTIAAEFDTSTSYTAGSYVYKNGVLYRFTQAHSGAWTGSDARIVTVGDDICENNEIFEQHEKEYIDFSMRVLNDASVPNDFIYGRYLSSGFSVTTAYARNKYPYPPGKYEIGPSPIANGFTAMEYISDTQGNVLISGWVAGKQTITPTRPWYITFNGVNSEKLAAINSGMVVKRISEQPDTLENAVDSAVTVAEEALDNFEKEYSKNRYNGVYFLGGGYVIPTSGGISSNSGHSYTSWIDVSNNNGENIVFSKVHSATGSFANLRYAFYKEDKTFTSGGVGPTLQTDNTLNRDYAVVQTPNNAAWMRYSFPNDGFSTEKCWQIEYTEPTTYSVYTRDYSGIKSSMIDENEIIEKVSSMTYGIKPEQATAETLTDGQTLVVENNSVMKNQCIAFFAKISGTFSGVYVGHGKGGYGYYIKVDGTNMTYCSNGSEGTAVAHGLTITDFIGVCVEVDVSLNVKVTITTSGGFFTKTQQINSSWRGDVFAESIGTSFTDVVLTWHSDDYKCPVWAFGDSYFTLYSPTRWPYYVAQRWGFNNILLNAYPGEDAANGYRDFTNALKHGKPKFVIWCEGMNNADSSTAINSSWLQTAEAVRDICAAYGITLIFTTIPIVTASGYNNTRKNEWIRNSGVRYVDFAAALENVDGWLSSDNVHPSEIGGRFMALKLLSDVPEIYQGK